MGANAPKKIHSSEYKRGPIQKAFDLKGHEVKPAKYCSRMIWLCDIYGSVPQVKLKFKPRKGKG